MLLYAPDNFSGDPFFSMLKNLCNFMLLFMLFELQKIRYKLFILGKLLNNNKSYAAFLHKKSWKNCMLRKFLFGKRNLFKYLWIQTNKRNINSIKKHKKMLHKGTIEAHKLLGYWKITRSIIKNNKKKCILQERKKNRGKFVNFPQKWFVFFFSIFHLSHSNQTMRNLSDEHKL